MTFPIDVCAVGATCWLKLNEGQTVQECDARMKHKAVMPGQQTDTKNGNSYN